MSISRERKPSPGNGISTMWGKSRMFMRAVRSPLRRLILFVFSLHAHAPVLVLGDFELVDPAIESVDGVLCVDGAESFSLLADEIDAPAHVLRGTRLLHGSYSSDACSGKSA